MSEPLQAPHETEARESDSREHDDAPNKGPNLFVLYSLIALALAAAIGCALMIVLPFYHRR